MRVRVVESMEVPPDGSLISECRSKMREFYKSPDKRASNGAMRARFVDPNWIEARALSFTLQENGLSD
jgi:hypothetical protein